MGILIPGKGKGICPRCGQAKMLNPIERNALSRKEDVYICSDCGLQEALEDAFKAGAFKKEDLE